MACDPSDPACSTDFDAEHPVEIGTFPGHTVRVYRDCDCPREDGARLVLEFDGERHVLRPARGYDTRATVVDAALPLARVLAAPDL